MTADPKVPGAFQLAHTKGSAFLSVRAMARQGTGKSMSAGTGVPMLELVETNAPVLPLNLEAPAEPAMPEIASPVSPDPIAGDAR